MHEIAPQVFVLPAVDFSRTFFDELIPLPHGTSYNSYLIQGNNKTALIDTVDPTFSEYFLHELDQIEKIDFVVSQHTEQDHSSLIEEVLKRFPSAKVLASAPAKELLVSHLHLEPEDIEIVTEKQILDLGGKTLQFFMTPWVHWPETMITYLAEDKILFTCDLFGTHLATKEIVMYEDPLVYSEAKRYFAELMMPFRAKIRSYLDTISRLPVSLIGPSHGPIFGKPSFILDAYRDWASESTKNLVVIPYVTMHGSTLQAVKILESQLKEYGIEVHMYDLSKADVGLISSDLVDARTIILAAPTLFSAPHPLAEYFLSLLNIIKPPAKQFGFIGSYAWATNAGTLVAENVRWQTVVLPSVTFQGLPDETTRTKLQEMAQHIRDVHAEIV